MGSISLIHSWFSKAKGMYIVLCIHQFYHCSWNVSEFFSSLEKKLETKANIINIHQIIEAECLDFQLSALGMTCPWGESHTITLFFDVVENGWLHFFHGSSSLDWRLILVPFDNRQNCFLLLLWKIRELFNDFVNKALS